MPSEALVPVEETGVVRPAMTLDEAQAGLEVLRRFVAKQLVLDEDYGVIPGTRGGKPTLLQPGAQKICTYFNLTPVPSLVREVLTEEFVSKTYSITVIDRTSGKPVASCVGSSNTAEGQFRPKPDMRQYENTCDKMAQKRALVGAVIIAVRAAGLFTQDLEEQREDTRALHVEPPTPVKPQPITAMPWGKYKGKRLDEKKEDGTYLVSAEWLQRIHEWAEKRSVEGHDPAQAQAMMDGITLELERRELEEPEGEEVTADAE